MSLRLAARIARAELKGGLQGFRVFLACLAFGIAAIAAVGIVREGIARGLGEQGTVLLGGDAEMSFTYRLASDDERRFMADHAVKVSEIVDFRSMAVTGTGDTAERALTQVKAVDDAYPLTGTVTLDPPMPLAEAFAPDAAGRPGGVMDGVLADRLGLRTGDAFRLGEKSFYLAAILTREPDSATGGFGLGPRSIVRNADLEGSGLLAPGSLFDSHYRLSLPAGTDLEALESAARAAFTDTGLRWRDSRRAAPGVERFVERIGAFLVLVGLAGLAVGGIGISAAVRAYLERKTAVIATLKSLGAGRWLVFQVYLMQIGALTLFGIALGLVLGTALVLGAAPLLVARLPFPIALAPYPGPMAEAALYGVLTALVFTLWPLSRAARIRAAALYRQAGGSVRGWPGAGAAIAVAVLATTLVGAAAALSGMTLLTLWSAAGIVTALTVLAATAWGLRRLAWRLAPRARGVPLRLALGAIGGPREEAGAVVLSLGLGLTVLAAMGQIDANLRAAIARDLPERAPSYFFVDIQDDQLPAFLNRLAAEPAVDNVETAPMLRGVITRINGQEARTVAGEHWVLRGDRGVTYADRPPASTTITAGTWWPEAYSGPPQLSFAREEAEELGLKLGDRLTVNILGRDIEAEITSFREVDFSTAGIGFVMLMNPAAVAGAPHSHIATVHTAPEAEARLLRDVAGAFPNITAIRVRDAIARVTEALNAIAAATAGAALVTLATGFVVLIGAAAAGEPARVYEAAVLKTLGATRARILASFALRSALLGASAGLVAVVAGGAAGWAVMHFVMDAPYSFEPASALLIVAGGVVAVLLAGLVFALRPLGARPARVLRAAD